MSPHEVGDLFWILCALVGSNVARSFELRQQGIMMHSKPRANMRWYVMEVDFREDVPYAFVL
jgi:hypothetical protein